MKTYLIFIFSFLLANQFTTGQDCGNSGSGSGSSTNCPDLNLSEIPTKSIRVTFHVFQDDEGEGNFTSSDEDWFEDLIDDINDDLSSLSTFTGNPSASVSDLKIEINLKNIYFWQDTEMHEKSNKSFSNGNDLYDFIEEQDDPSVQYLTNSIHFFFPGNDPSSSEFGGLACGFGCKQWSFIMNGYTRLEPEWGLEDMSQLIEHELGHNLRLFHTNSIEEDNCEDTPETVNNNNIMRSGYGSRYALSQCQAGRIHKWLNEEAPELIESGHQDSGIEGTITYSGGSTSMSCCTQGVPASSIDIEITAPENCDIEWTRDGGFGGTLSSSNNGYDLDIDNLGSIFLSADWYENCNEEYQTWVFFYYESFMAIGPNPSSDYLSINIKNPDEWLSFIDPSSIAEKSYLDSWEIRSEEGILQKKGNVEKGLSSLKIKIFDLKEGFYFLTLRKANTNYSYSFLKI